MLTFLCGVCVFSLVVLFLVVSLLLARAFLIPNKLFSVAINGDTSKTLELKGGASLLIALATKGIFIPSACGGKGTCGVCKLKVTEGGGKLLATEAGHIGLREQNDGVRLACQLKLRGDMALDIPSEILEAKRWSCRVRSNENVATFIKELVLELPEGEAMPFRAGGFIQIRALPFSCSFGDFEIGREYRDAWDRFDLWRYAAKADRVVERAYSMANYPGESGIIMLNVRIATPPPSEPDLPPGLMSSYIFNLKPGDKVSISGPFGEFFARETEKEMVFIGGGAGMAPMRSHIFDQFRRIKTRRKVSFWYGARSLREMFYIDDFDGIAAENENFSWTPALSEPQKEDNWSGKTGFIHQVLYDEYLKDHPAPEEIEYYLCGPPIMNKCCIDMLLELGVEREDIMFDDFGS